MRRVFLPSLLLLVFCNTAQAAEIRILGPGLIGPALPALAVRWETLTGHKVIIDYGSMRKVQETVAAGGPGDLVLAPPSELAAMAAKTKSGSEKPVGHAVFALVLKAGALHPDIATVEKFRAALKGKTVGYNNPAGGSLAGKMVEALLRQPEYAGINGMATQGLSAQAAADGKVDMAIVTHPEVVALKGIEIVSPIPEATGLRLDITGAVLAAAAYPQEAASFLAYITQPQFAEVWRPTGLVAP